MNRLQEQFSRLRDAGTPWCLIRTPDYRECIRSLLKIDKASGGPIRGSVWTWDCLEGHRCITDSAATSLLGSPDDTVQAPALLLKKLPANLPNDSVLFMVIPTAGMIEDASVIQGIANVRDQFKATKRTLVLLARELKLPAFLAEDIPVIDEPLPQNGEIKDLISTLIEPYADTPEFDDSASAIDAAADLCRGLTRFATEEAVARNLTKRGIDLAGLREAQRGIVEYATDRGLVYERGEETFESIGGQAAFKQYLTGIFSGPRRPKVIVRIDEIEKSISQAASGANADNTGVSQRMLKYLLTSMEDRRWLGALLLGGPGTGKTLASVCAGNTFKVRTLVCDLDSTLSSGVGDSEGAIRTMLDVIYSIGGQDVMFLATCNALDTLPAALQRRFTQGVWFFDLPNEAERQAIWRIQTKKFGVEGDLPEDAGWTGSDIRNCCQTAYMMRSSPKEAAQWITLAGQTARADIERLREMAETRGFRSANYPGTYRRVAQAEGRSIRL